MERFQVNAYPNRKEKIQLAMSFNTTVNTVKNWFVWMRHKKVANEMLNRGEYCSERYYNAVCFI